MRFCFSSPLPPSHRPHRPSLFGKSISRSSSRHVYAPVKFGGVIFSVPPSLRRLLGFLRFSGTSFGTLGKTGQGVSLGYPWVTQAVFGTTNYLSSTRLRLNHGFGWGRGVPNPRVCNFAIKTWRSSIIAGAGARATVCRPSGTRTVMNDDTQDSRPGLMSVVAPRR